MAGRQQAGKLHIAYMYSQFTVNISSRWPGMVEDDPDYNCCYETDESDVNPVRILYIQD